MKKGYYARLYGRDCFMETNATRRSKQLALEMVNKVQNHLNRFTNVTDADLVYIQNGMRQVTMEVKTIQNGNFKGKRYIDIKGNGFGFGTDACDDPYSVCVIV